MQFSSIAMGDRRSGSVAINFFTHDPVGCRGPALGGAAAGDRGGAGAVAAAACTGRAEAGASPHALI